MIRIPKHLNIDAPEHMPIIELGVKLADAGYMLVNRLDGDVEAVPISRMIDVEPYSPARHEDHFRDEYQPPLRDDEVCEVCGSKLMHCPGHINED